MDPRYFVFHYSSRNWWYLHCPTAFRGESWDCSGYGDETLLWDCACADGWGCESRLCWVPKREAAVCFCLSCLSDGRVRGSGGMFVPPLKWYDRWALYVLSISQMSIQIDNWALQAVCKPLGKCLHFQHHLLVLHCFWLRAAASIYESNQKSQSSWEPGSWTVGAVHATSSDVARLEQPEGLVEFSKENARHEALQLCVPVRKLVLVCEAVPSDPHLRSSALLNSKACNLLHIQFGNWMWQLIKVKVEGRGPGNSLLTSSQASSGCLAHLCCHLCKSCPPENHRTHF